MRYLIRPMDVSDIDAVIKGEEKAFGKSLFIYLIFPFSLS